MKKLFIPNKNNQNIAIAIHEPKDSNSKLAILCPGFLDSKDYLHLIGLAERLVYEGYTAVRFDPLGTWESEGDISEYTSENYLETIRTVKKYMLSQNNYSEILIGGHSRGGKMSIIYAAQDSDIKVVINIMGSTGERKLEILDPLPEFVIKYRNLPNSLEENKVYNLPYELVIDASNYSSLDVVGKISGAILSIAGELDTVITPEIVESVDKLAHEPKEYVLMKGIGHNYRHNKDEIKIVNDVVINWLKEL